MIDYIIGGFYVHWIRIARGHEGRVDDFVKDKLGSFHIGTRGYTQNRPQGHLPQIGNRPKGPTYGTEKEETWNGKIKGGNARNGEIVEGRIH